MKKGNNWILRFEFSLHNVKFSAIYSTKFQPLVRISNTRIRFLKHDGSFGFIYRVVVKLLLSDYFNSFKISAEDFNLCAKSSIIQNKRQGLKFCKICQCLVDNVEEHMNRKHPKYAEYLQKREEKEALSICGYCGRMIKNWRAHVQESHPELIAAYARKKKPKEEDKEEDFSKMFNL